LYILALIGYNHVTLPKPSHLHVNKHHVTWLSHMVHRELADWKKYKKIDKDVIYYCSTFCISFNHQYSYRTKEIPYSLPHSCSNYSAFPAFPITVSISEL